MTTSPVRDRTAVVVGATGGIGTAVAAEFEASHRLWLVGRDRARTEEVARRLRDAEPWIIDLAAPIARLRLPRALVALDLLVLCAGTWAYGAIAQSTDAAWAELFAVNVFGQVALARALLPALRAAHGRVVVLSSTALMGAPGMRSAYTASKAALKVFAEALQEEERGNGVEVTSVYPGRTATPMQREVTRSEGADYVPANYLAPETVARTIRGIVELGPEAHVGELVVRPPFLHR